MAEEKEQQGELKNLQGGQQPSEFGEQPLINKGYQAISGNLDITNPPKGGSGVPSGVPSATTDNTAINKK